MVHSFISDMENEKKIQFFTLCKVCLEMPLKLHMADILQKY